jgi:hypothetical protein
MTGTPDWMLRVLSGETLTAAEHFRLAEELMAFSERTARANPDKGRYACVTTETERAKVHAILALAAASAPRPDTLTLPPMRAETELDREQETS